MIDWMDNIRKGSSFEGKYYLVLIYFYGGFRVWDEIIYDFKGKLCRMKVYFG